MDRAARRRSPGRVHPAVASPSWACAAGLARNRVVADEPVQPSRHQFDMRTPAGYVMQLERVVVERELRRELGQVGDLTWLELAVTGVVRPRPAAADLRESIHLPAVDRGQL